MIPKTTTTMNTIDSKESGYKFPLPDLLEDYSQRQYSVSKGEMNRTVENIKALFGENKITVDNIDYISGPALTVYKVKLTPKNLNKLRKCEEDIVYDLYRTLHNAYKRHIRIVYGDDCVDIEITNEHPSLVSLKSLLDDACFKENKFELPIVVGRSTDGKVKVFDLAASPNVLVAGCRYGKTMALNAMITSLLYTKCPSELKLVLIDPKGGMEYAQYTRLANSFLATIPAVSDESDDTKNFIARQPQQAERMLLSLCEEMDKRYMKHCRQPYIVVVIDEYSLIMSGNGVKSRKVHDAITHLAQSGPSVGIHLIISTWNSSTDIITDRIKENFQIRISFCTSTSVDSVTVLDVSGAEELAGDGDMLYYDGTGLERVQGGYIGWAETRKIVDFISSGTDCGQCSPYYLPAPGAKDYNDDKIDPADLDPMLREAAEIVVSNQQGSASTLQRKLGLGYARACRIMGQLEALGVVGPQNGAKPRKVLISNLEELDRLMKIL